MLVNKNVSSDQRKITKKKKKEKKKSIGLSLSTILYVATIAFLL